MLAEMNDTRLLYVCIMCVCYNIFFEHVERRAEQRKELNVDCNKWRTRMWQLLMCMEKKIENKCKSELE